MKKRLVVFDEALHTSMRTVNGLVDERRQTALQIGDYKSGVFSQGRHFCFEDNAPGNSPGVGLIKK